jgi:Putative addiction module component
MNERIKALFAGAQELAPVDREELAEMLLATLDAPVQVEAAWAAEAHERWSEHVANGDATIDAVNAVEQVRQDLARLRGK